MRVCQQTRSRGCHDRVGSSQLSRPALAKESKIPNIQNFSSQRHRPGRSNGMVSFPPFFSSLLISPLQTHLVCNLSFFKGWPTPYKNPTNTIFFLLRLLSLLGLLGGRAGKILCNRKMNPDNNGFLFFHHSFSKIIFRLLFIHSQFHSYNKYNGDKLLGTSPTTIARYHGNKPDASSDTSFIRLGTETDIFQSSQETEGQLKASRGTGVSFQRTWSRSSVDFKRYIYLYFPTN